MILRLLPFKILVGLLVLLVSLALAFYVFFPLLQEAINIQAEDKSALETACRECHSEMAASQSENMHLPFQEGRCLDCHEPHPEDEPELKLVTERNRLCLNCHYMSDELKLDSQHEPFTKGDCLGCHNPHGSDYKKILRAEENKVCFSCHFFSAQLKKKSIHLPFTQGMCLNCHKPHASPYKTLRRLDKNNLCFVCHYDRRRNSEFPVKHKPYGEGNCSGCHKGHATDYKPLLPMERKSLCLSCHKQLKNTLPYQHEPFKTGECNDCHLPHVAKYEDLAIAESIDLCYLCHSKVKSDFAKPSIHPVKKNGDLECKNCHEPHFAPVKGLLFDSGNSFCFTCHPHIKATYLGSDHERALKSKFNQSNCKNCHLHHGSDYKPILQMDSLNLCLQCHKNKIGPNNYGGYNHPVGKPHYDEYFEKDWLTCKSCHKIHSVYPELLRKRKNLLCLTCHEYVDGWWMLYEEDKER